MFSSVKAIAALVVTASVVNAETVRDVFVLSIGSGDYAEAESSGVYAFPDNEAAYLGARRVARVFRDGGARHVIQLLGRDGEYLTAVDIYTAIDDAAAEARASRAADPVLIVYFSGHGFSETFGYSLFLAPGDLVIPHAALDLDTTITTVLDVEAVAIRAPTGLALKETLDATGIPYFLILDTCFETDTNLDLEALQLVSQTITDLSRDVSDIIRVLNLPRGPHPVLFSAPPGTLALPEQDPIDGYSYIAPMARRLVLAAQAAGAAKETLDMAQVVKALTQDDQNLGGEPGVTWFAGSFETGPILAPGTYAPTSIERRRGTAYAATTCCQESLSGRVPDTETVKWIIEGEVAFHPAGEDFVTDGQSFEARFEADEVTVSEVTENGVEIDVDLEDGSWFSLAISVPGTAFEPGVFVQVQRHGFTETNRPGMSVSIEGRACNEVAGTFELEAVGKDTDGALRALDVKLRQICDDGPGALVGSARLSFAPVIATKVPDPATPR